MSVLGAFIVWLAMAAGVSRQALAAAPPAVAGTWDVVRVAVDREDAVHWGMRPDDPRLLGRTLVMNGDRVQFAHGKKLGCTQSAWSPTKTTWGSLIAKGFAASPTGDRRGIPTPANFELKVRRTDTATAYVLCPSADTKFPKGYWVATQGDELVLRYGGQVMLILKRRPLDAKPSPSFDCAKAKTPTEKAICGDFDLAGLDRSVAKAYRDAVQSQAAAAAELRKSQAEWLKERDACASKTDCIYNLEWARVEELAVL
jgi:uncharacterized protein YecT (DUF1311 family)